MAWCWPTVGFGPVQCNAVRRIQMECEALSLPFGRSWEHRAWCSILLGCQPGVREAGEPARVQLAIVSYHLLILLPCRCSSALRQARHLKKDDGLFATSLMLFCCVHALSGSFPPRKPSRNDRVQGPTLPLWISSCASRPPWQHGSDQCCGGATMARHPFSHAACPSLD